MKKIYHLSTCDTCKRILSEINPPGEVSLQDIKTAVDRIDFHIRQVTSS